MTDCICISVYTQDEPLLLDFGLAEQFAAFEFRFRVHYNFGKE